MVIYLIVFVVSVFLFFLSERINNKFLKWLAVTLGILIPTVLAGLRDRTIGSDTRGYGSVFYKWAAASSSFSQYTAKVHSMGDLTDYGFHMLYFISSRFFADYHMGLFLASLITTTFFYLAYKRLKKLFDIPIWCGMLIYYLSMYNTTLNMIRQSIAVSIVFFAFSFMLEKRYGWYIIWNLIAMLFHTSAAVGFMGFIAFIILGNDSSSIKKNLFRLSCLFVPFVAILINAQMIVTKLVKVGLFRSNYLNYLSGALYSRQDNGFHLTAFILPAIFLLCDLFLFKYTSRIIRCSIFLDFMVFFSLILSFTTMVSVFAYRIAYYYIPLEYTTQIIYRKCFTKLSRGIWVAFVIGMIAFLWGYDIVYLNSNETVPYVLMSFN